MRMGLTYLASWGVAIGVAAALWSDHRAWVAIVVGLVVGFPIFLVGLAWAGSES